MSKFDALALEVDKPSRMVIVHPVTRQPIRDADGTEAYISLFSGDSEPARKHQRTVSRRRLAMRGRGKLTPEELEAEAVELLAVVTTGWLLLDFNGKPIDVEFSQDNARELYGLSALSWIREQVDEFVADRGNFSKASSKS
jgi:hypothetical protein